MAAVKLLNLLAISTLAILACSFAVNPVNALSADTLHLVRDIRGHDAVAKRKRSSTPQRRCKPRTPPAPTTTSSSSVARTVAAAAATTTTSTHNSGGNNGGGGGGGGGKVGIVWPNGDDNSLHYYKTWKVTGFYTWSPEIPKQARDLGFEVIPMLWGDRQIWQFQQLVHAGYAHTVLGMNEPNEPGQSNMSPEHGAYLWETYIQPLSNQGYALISPATSSNPNGMVWMKNFFNACNGCTFDGVAVHWYDIHAQDFIDYINNWHSTFDKPIWVTEFACQNYNGGPQCTQDQVNNFMATVTGYMDNTDWVVAYFAFGVMHDMSGVNPDNQLMSPDGSPTPLGWQYIQ